MEVTLCAVGNPDFRQPRRLPGVRSRTVTVASFAEASKLCREYIFEHELGMGNWTGGQIVEGGRQIAQVSYNGRVWEGHGSPGAKEISIR